MSDHDFHDFQAHNFHDFWAYDFQGSPSGKSDAIKREQIFGYFEQVFERLSSDLVD